jgi:hypothetical protein
MAIYYDKNVLLLNTKHKRVIQKALRESPEVLARDEIVNFNIRDSFECFLKKLNDTQVF